MYVLFDRVSVGLIGLLLLFLFVNFLSFFLWIVLETLFWDCILGHGNLFFSYNSFKVIILLDLWYLKY